MIDTYPEPYRSAEKDSLVDPSTCYNRECVSYCAWKIAELIGTWPHRTGSMNAREWIYRLPENGYNEIATPHAGCVGILPAGQYGHALFVEAVNGNIATISEYNYNYNGNYHTRDMEIAGSGYRFYEIVGLPAPTPATTPEPETGAVVDTPAIVSALAVGDTVIPTRLVSYDGVSLTQWDNSYTLIELIGDRAVLEARGQVWAAMNVNDIAKG